MKDSFIAAAAYLIAAFFTIFSPVLGWKVDIGILMAQQIFCAIGFAFIVIFSSLQGGNPPKFPLG